MRRAILLVVLVAGCGRIGFDETGDAGSSGPGEWASVSTGQRSSCAIATDRSLWCWGDNGYYQSSPIVSDYVPVTRIGTSEWSHVDVGSAHTCGIQIDGSLWCWGADDAGQIGDGAAGGNALTPTRVGSDLDWIEVDAARFVTCARKTTGTMWCWGTNSYGELGIGAATAVVMATPVQVGTDSDWIALEAAPDSVCGVRAGGTGWCWGEDYSGQLGDGMAVARQPTPVAAIGAKRWKKIAIGDDHTCAIDTDDHGWCWGSNARGQLGTGGNFTKLVATEVVGGGTWLDIATGARHTCGVKTDGSVWCWGDSSRGQGGVITRELITMPEQRATGYVGVTAYAHNTCWHGAHGSIVCMGDTGDGQNPHEMPMETPELHAVDGPWIALALGARHGCGLRTNSNVACWGSGVIGDGRRGDSKVPIELPMAFARLAAGYDFTVALGFDRTIWQWGHLPSGQEELVPVQIGAAANWYAVTAGPSHACAQNTANEVWCWGNNAAGQLGDGTLVAHPDPAQVAGVFTNVDAGDYHTCAISGGGVRCWGQNMQGQLGTGDTTSALVPTPTLMPGGTWVQVVAGAAFSCARDATRFIACFGRNTERELANGSTAMSIGGVAATAFADWTDLAAGDEHMCGMRAGSAALWCWGHRHHLADDFTDATNVGAFASYAGGVHVGCALDTVGMRHCWGRNADGQYGDGTGWSDAPWPIVKP